MYKYILTLLAIAFSDQISQECNIARLIREEINTRKLALIEKQEKLSKILTPSEMSFVELHKQLDLLKSDFANSDDYIYTIEAILTRFKGIAEFDSSVDQMIDLLGGLDFVFTVMEYDDIINRIKILAERLRAQFQRLQVEYQNEVDSLEPVTLPQMEQQAQVIEENCDSLRTADLFAALVSNSVFISSSGLSLDVDGELNSIKFQGNFTTNFSKFSKTQGFTIEDEVARSSSAMGFAIPSSQAENSDAAFKISIFGSEIQLPPTNSTSTSSCHLQYTREKELSPSLYLQATDGTSVHVDYLDKVYLFSCPAVEKTKTLRLDVTEGTLGIFRLAYYRTAPEKPYEAIAEDPNLWQGADSDCESRWSQWSDCDSTTGLSIKTRRNEIIRALMNGGNPCSDDYFQISTCETTPELAISPPGIYQYSLVKNTVDSEGLSSDLDRNIIVEKSLVINFENIAKMLSTEFFFTLEVTTAPFYLFDIEQKSNKVEFSMQLNHDRTVTIKIGRKTLIEERNVDETQMEIRFGGKNTITNLIVDASKGYQTPCAKGCEVVMMGDGICDPECANKACEWDEDDCEKSNCSEECLFSDIGNGVCNQACRKEECGMDRADCNKCQAEGCSLSNLGNGFCDWECNNKYCELDWGDCANPFMSFIL